MPGQRDGRGYLLAVDADPDAPEVNGYPVDLLYENLSRLDARSITVFVDACFSGDSAGGPLVSGYSGIGVTPKTPSGAAITVLTAAQADQVASWDREAKQGLFTKYLLAGLSGTADGGPWVVIAAVGARHCAARRGYGNASASPPARRRPPPAHR